MKKAVSVLLGICVASTMVVSLAACDSNNEPEGTYYTVTYMDDDTVLKTEQVEEGGYATEYTPTKDGGYEFVDWFTTPSKNHYFDFTTAITSDTTIYAGFTLYVEDTRDFYVLGSGTSELLFTSDWGNVITDAHKLTKADGKNEYSITMDLKEGDQFQFAINSEWANKRGYGYLASTTLSDGTVAFSGEGSVYDDSSKGSNIVCEYSGNYTLTLKTYPNDDYYNTSGTGYTEERKEIYNLGTYDKIEWVRNGDVINNTVTVTDFYIKGASITNWTDMYNSDTQMVNNSGIYTLSVYLKAGEEFMFTSRITSIEDDVTSYATGSVYIKASNIAETDTTSTQYVSATSTGNITAVSSGTYTFTYDSDTTVLTVTCDTTATPASYDYYLDGSFGDGYGAFITTPDSYKMTETSTGSGVYTISNVTLAADDQLLIRAYVAGETADWNHTHIDYQYANMASNSAFSAASDTNNNIMVLTAGTYDISFDSYSKIITIIEHSNSADIYDIYIKGTTVNGWSHNFSSEYCMTISSDGTTYEITIALTQGDDFGFELHTKGETTGYGTYLNYTKLGSSGDDNSNFSATSGNNFLVSTAGTYKIVYTIATETIDFYTVS